MSRGKWKKKNLLKVCKSGKHKFTKKNTGVRKDGTRYCLACGRERIRRWRERQEK